MTHPTSADPSDRAPVAEACEYFVACMPGLEGVVADELRALGAAQIEPRTRGVACTGDAGLRYRANLWLRAAIRVLEPILSAEVSTPESLYDAVRTVDWTRYMGLRQTLSVDCRLRDSQMTHSGYAALKVKDAVVDQFRERFGERPNVDPENASLPLHLYLYRNRITLSRDSSGTTLHKRGYREAMVKSPLNEALAAGILCLMRWDAASALADPMCGSGTLPIEAAMIAARLAPGRLRKRFAFQSWPDYDAAAWKSLKESARAGELEELPFPIYASDHHEGALALARDGARQAGVEKFLRFSCVDVGEFRADPPPRTLVFNPPYGERLDADRDLVDVYRRTGSMLRRFPGARAWVLSGNAALTRWLGLRAAREIKLLNGTIDCRLMCFEMFSSDQEAARQFKHARKARRR